jgi:hypothetical protein
MTIEAIEYAIHRDFRGAQWACRHQRTDVINVSDIIVVVIRITVITLAVTVTVEELGRIKWERIITILDPVVIIIRVTRVTPTIEVVIKLIGVAH